MVKNQFGGSNHKKFASKHQDSKRARKLRISEEKAEIYAITTKIFGNKFIAMCIDGKERAVMIRGKFSGKGKHDNFVAVGTWVLIGSRAEWSTETDKNGLDICDLLEVYSNQHRDELKRTLPLNWSILISNDFSIAEDAIKECDEGGVVFESNSARDDLRRVLEADISNKPVAFTESKDVEDEDDEDEVNFDDI